jgi:U6 snRNA-associated Sm-like protein LSm1
MLGEIDLDKDDDIPAGYEKASVELVHTLAKELERKRRRDEKRNVGLLKGEGFESENVGEVFL